MKHDLEFSRRLFALAAATLLAAALFAGSSAANTLDPDLVPLKELAERESKAGDAGARAMLLALHNAASEAETKAGYEWLARAAQKGHPAAQFQMGLLAERSGAENIGEAIMFYLAAAKQGFALAQSNLAALYARGEGVVQNDTQAAEWSLLAAMQGNALSQFRLGSMYAAGRGVPKDMAKAAEWLEKAATQGLANAQAHLGALYLAGQGVAKDEARGMFWIRKASELGQPEATRILAAASAEGKTAKAEPPNFAKSRLAADGGDTIAQYTLALMYQRGEAGAPRDPIEAAKWMSRSAEKGYAPAQAQLGFYYANAIGVSRDEEEAVRWFKLAVKQGHAQAQASLANFHSRGAGGLSRDLNEAARLYKLAADQGNAAGQAGYAYHLEQGIGGVQQDIAAAKAMYAKAAAQGNPYAQQQLQRLGN
ncbi:MAG: sel1 repeat family protein [Betaproteobacteria bacterium]|nr:sel1 repeat family protein [Betaproteobacteria bacterium]